METRPLIRRQIHVLTERLLQFADVLPEDLTRHLWAMWEELEEISHEEWAASYIPYISVACKIEAWIARGELAPGEPLPIQRELARQFCVSESTIRRATKKLANRNLVRHKGGRIIITDTASDSSSRSLTATRSGYG
jgi:Bacterial regulatory proteins, gntR family